MNIFIKVDFNDITIYIHIYMQFMKLLGRMGLVSRKFVYYKDELLFYFMMVCIFNNVLSQDIMPTRIPYHSK